MSDWKYSVEKLGWVNSLTQEFNERNPAIDPLAGANQPKSHTLGLEAFQRIRDFKAKKLARTKKL